MSAFNPLNGLPSKNFFPLEPKKSSKKEPSSLESKVSDEHKKVSTPKAGAGGKPFKPTVLNRTDSPIGAGAGRIPSPITGKTKIVESSTTPSPEVTEEQALQASVKKLAQTSKKEPLVSITQGETDNAVYMTQFPRVFGVDNVVFKPDKRAQFFNIIAYQLARLVGINQVVLPATDGRATVMPDEDNLELVNDGTMKVAVDKNEVLSIKDFVETSAGFTCKIEGQTYKFIKQKDDSYAVSSDAPKKKKETGDFTDFESPLSFELSLDTTGFHSESESDDEEVSSAPIDTSSLYKIIYKDGKGQSPPYLVKKDDIIVCEEVEGMVQKKVENAFTGNEHIKGRKDSPLNLLNKSDKRESFYNKIDRESFIECFIATILLRTEDGKITDLGSNGSNVLFTETTDKTLQLNMIDLDEILPAENGAPRTGLTAFPQALEKLEGDEKDFAIQLLKGILTKKAEIRELLVGFAKSIEKEEEENLVFGEENIKAMEEILERLGSFLEANRDNDWSLQTLLFAVLPEYEKQWNMLEGVPAVDRAMHVGFTPITEFDKIKARPFSG